MPTADTMDGWVKLTIILVGGKLQAVADFSTGSLSFDGRFGGAGAGGGTSNGTFTAYTSRQGLINAGKVSFSYQGSRSNTTVTWSDKDTGAVLMRFDGEGIHGGGTVAGNGEWSAA